MTDTKEPKVTVLPAGTAHGAFSVADWANQRARMRDKGRRAQENKKSDRTVFPKKPRPPRTPR